MYLCGKLHIMIPQNQPYRADNTMRELIRDNSLLLMVLSRFNIPLGFGDKSIFEVCDAHGVDTPTFLTVANFISGRPVEQSNTDLTALTGYLRRAHSYFLDFILPNIRRKLLSALDCSGADKIAFLILRFFDEYVGEVRLHMEYENNTVFGYIDSLLGGGACDTFSIREFASHHKRMESKLNELKDILIRYCPNHNHDMLNSVLFDIINCEQDLASHCSVEDHLLVPAVIKLEKDVNENRRGSSSAAQEKAEANAQDSDRELSVREKEIIAAIAIGLSNKEIADRLCISVHTAATHRRNICAKLGIHSAAGLTIYAIVNHLVDINEIKTI